MKNRWLLTWILLLVTITYSCTATGADKHKQKNMNQNKQIAVFGAGCFWCVEAVFMDLKGVDSVKSGYTGGSTVNPTYKEVCTGNTGHAEVVYIEYDSTIISYEKLLEVFFTVHDPTQLNRQGNDVGTQYRSEIFYTTEEQKNIATTTLKALTDQEVFPYPIVTQLSALGKFYPAEDYHDNYFNLNPNESYCQMVVKPKVEKLRKVFAADMK